MAQPHENTPVGVGTGNFGRYLLVGALYLAITLPFLGAPPLFDPDEGYYPETAREMLARGNWLDPVFNGEPRWGKPVGVYFFQCVSMDALGLNETAARLPSVAAGLAFTLLVLSLGLRLYGPRTGLFAGLAAACMLQTVVYSRSAVPDMLLALGVALALWGFSALIVDDSGPSGNLRGRLALWLGCALGFLAKGPLGALLPGLTAALFLIATRELRRIPRLWLLRGGSLFLAAAAPWFIYMYLRHGDEFLNEAFLQQNLERYFTGRWQHEGPPWYYLPVLILGTFPWSAAVLGGLSRSFGSLWSIILGRSNSRSGRADLFVWCWLAGMLVFFSFSRSKLPNYVLPLYPALALAGGRFMAGLEESPSRGWKIFLGLGTAFVALTAFGAGALILPRKVGLAPELLWTALAPLGLVAAAGLSLKLRRGPALWAGLNTAAIALFFALVTGLVVPRVERLSAVKNLCREHVAASASGERILLLDTWAPSALFYGRHLAVRFLAERDSLPDYLAGDVRWVLTREKNRNRLPELAGRKPQALYIEGGFLLAHFDDPEKP